MPSTTWSGAIALTTAERPRIAHRLMMRRVHLHLGRTHDAMQQRAAAHRDWVAGFVARVGLLVFQRVGVGVGNVLDQRAAECHREKLLAAADAEDRHVAGQRAVGECQFGGGAVLFQRHRGVAVGVAVQHGIDVERAAGDDECVDAVEIGRGERCIVRQCDRQATGCDDRIGVVLPDGIPGVFRVAARLLGIEGDADDGTLGHGVIANAPRRGRARAASHRPARRSRARSA